MELERLDARRSAEALRKLAAPQSGPRITLQIPLRPFPAGQNAVMARQADEEARRRLAKQEADVQERERLEQGIAAATEAAATLHPPVGTVVAYVDGSGARLLHVAETLPSQVAVGSGLRLRPVLRADARSGRYRVLALSVNRVKLYEGDADGLVEVALGEVPDSLVAALGSELSEHQVRVRGKGGLAGGDAAVHYSMGARSDEQHRDLERYHTALAPALSQRLAGDDAPLVWVSDVTHHPLRQRLSLPGLLPGSVDTNPDHLSASALHERCWPLVRAAREQREHASVQRLERARSLGKAAEGLDELAMAAIAGRIRHLWVEADRSEPGRIDAASGRVVAPSGDDDVYEDLCALALAKGGEVHVLDPGRVPSPSGAVAELR